MSKRVNKYKITLTKALNSYFLYTLLVAFKNG